MGVFQRRSDPIRERERALQKQLRALESQITALDVEARETERFPRVRSTIRPREIPARNPFSSNQELVFEPVDKEPIKAPESLDISSAHYNEHGVKKLDLVQLWRRAQALFRHSPTAQSKFVNYLVAGSIQGIRPLRYERRIARNRFLMLFAFLLVLLFGIFALLQGQF
ncbi:MAG: hypothetical protein M2R45_03897 [Verrucomicrobia subdivision 3 bacterium]|nr:hypothetical protein [Limisphaerales bacterium]MCS1412600.1 hypothetical protein [Limisphaerales bacterium]